jgi:hypothetical protein
MVTNKELWSSWSLKTSNFDNEVENEKEKSEDTSII